MCLQRIRCAVRRYEFWGQERVNFSILFFSVLSVFSVVGFDFFTSSRRTRWLTPEDAEKNESDVIRSFGQNVRCAAV